MTASKDPTPIVDSLYSTGAQRNMVWKHAKNHGLKLIPFFKTLGLYFLYFIPAEEPSVFAMILKCLPIVGLWIFVYMHIISGSERQTFSRRILVGLAFSCLGDAFLIWPLYFPHGMAAFGVAQMCYSSAFGFKHPHWTVGGIIYGINAVALAIIVPNMKDVPLAVVVGMPIYSMLLMTTVWRGIARVEYLGTWTGSKMCSSFGVLMFAFSDSLISISEFFMPVPYAQFLIMSTYYIAQLFIALSIVSVEHEKSNKVVINARQSESVSNGKHQLSSNSLELSAKEIKSGQLLGGKSSPVLRFHKSLL